MQIDLNLLQQYLNPSNNITPSCGTPILEACSVSGFSSPTPLIIAPSTLNIIASASSAVSALNIGVVSAGLSAANMVQSCPQSPVALPVHSQVPTSLAIANSSAAILKTTELPTGDASNTLAEKDTSDKPKGSSAAP